MMSDWLSPNPTHIADTLAISKTKMTMSEFEFKGKWSTKLNFNSISVLRSPKFYKRDSHLEWIRNKGKSLDNNLVDIKICDAPNKNEYPETNQVNAINHLLNNEEQILSEIFRVMKHIVYPYYGELVGEDYETADPLNTISELKNALAINEIMIDFIGKDDIAWTTFIFEANVDCEHGLSMLFQGSKFLKHGSAYDMMYQELLTKEEYEKHLIDINVSHDSENPELHYPDATKKYFKPWELEQSKQYLINLLRAEKEDEFLRIIDDENFDINIKFPELNKKLIEEVLRVKKLNIAKYMVSKGAEIDNILHQGNIYYENKTRINLIGELELNIDQVDSNNKSLLDKYLEIAEREFRREKSDRFILLEEHVKLILSYGARINNRDKYEKLLKHWKIKNDGGWLNKLFK